MKNGKGGIYNFVTKRGICQGNNSKISWTQVETGSAITWKYPSVILKGDNSIGEFYSVALTNNHATGRYRNQDDSSWKKYKEQNCFKRNFCRQKSEQLSWFGSVLERMRMNARNYSQCDSLLLGR